SGLPAGLKLDSSGLIAGTLSRPSSTVATIAIRDSSDQLATTSFRWTVKFAAVLSSAKPTARCVAGTGGHRACTYSAPSRQTIYALRGRRARVSLRLITSTGAALRRAVVSIA